MSRVRISTTVDESALRAARRQLGVRDSELFDRALRLLLEELESQAELRALEAAPYREDEALQLPEPDLTGDLPYEGAVPAEVIELAERRRAQR
jgi:hypothetical protein